MKTFSGGKDYRLTVKSTKTGNSRMVSIDEKTMRILKVWEKQQKLDR